MLRISRILAAVSAPVLLASLTLTTGPAQAASGGAVTYVVRAYIDGHSRLTLRGSTARWFHIAFEAPGRGGGKNLPTIINGTKWFPQWPQPGVNWFCGCHSSFFRHVTPPVPQQADTFFFEAVKCRDTCSARYANGVLCINFNDDSSSGAAWYQVKVTLDVDVQ